MLASWRVVRDFEVLDDGTGAGIGVAWAAAGRKPARKDLDRRAAALVTTFLEWAEAVLESRGADIWYYCYYMSRNSGLSSGENEATSSGFAAAGRDVMVQSSGANAAKENGSFCRAWRKFGR